MAATSILLMKGRGPLVSSTRKQRLLDDNVSSENNRGDQIISNWEIFDVLCEINARLNSVERSVKILMEDRYARR